MVDVIESDRSEVLTEEEAEAEGIEQDQYLVFIAGTQEYGIQAMRVQEISAMVAITRIPKAPVYIEGILNLRGRLISVVDFRRRLGFDPHPHDEDTRVVIVEHGGYPIGLVVDRVEEVIRIPDDKVQELPEGTVVDVAEEYITGVGMLDKRLIVLLDADKLLSKAEIQEVTAAQAAPIEKSPAAKAAAP